jgi:ElaB/YqjD/DUF883 family membrane-anchored ribosome-binding protein
MTPTNTLPNEMTDAVKSTGDKIADTASQLKSKVNDFGRAAVDKIDDTRTAAASGLDSTASALHQSGAKMNDLAHNTADKLSSTADYLRTHDTRRMMADVESLVKNNPGPSLIAAAAIGFLVGRALRSSD